MARAGPVAGQRQPERHRPAPRSAEFDQRYAARASAAVKAAARSRTRAKCGGAPLQPAICASSTGRDWTPALARPWPSAFQAAATPLALLLLTARLGQAPHGRRRARADRRPWAAARQRRLDRSRRRWRRGALGVDWRPLRVERATSRPPACPPPPARARHRLLADAARDGRRRGRPARPHRRRRRRRRPDAAARRARRWAGCGNGRPRRPGRRGGASSCCGRCCRSAARRCGPGSPRSG